MSTRSTRSEIGNWFFLAPPKNDRKHTDCVWEVKWVGGGKSEESLMTVSADGKIFSWT